MTGSDSPRPARKLEGLAASLHALRNESANPKAWYRGAVEALDAGHPHLAARLFEACLRHDPDHIWAAYGLAKAHFRLGAFEAADKACRIALAIQPRHTPSLLTRGHLCRMLGDSVAAVRFYDAALADEGTVDRVDSGLVHLRLALGDHRAWNGFRPDAPSQQLPEGGPWSPPEDRIWRGETAPEESVCVYKDGGNGDIFFFARFISAVAERVGNVFLTAPSSHERLLASLSGLAGIVRRPEELPHAKFVHLWSLPGLLGLTSPDVGPQQGYLRPPSTGPEIAHLAGFRVGLAWAGHPNTAINPDRSVPSVALLRPLFELEGLEWVSLQVGYRADEASELPFAARPEVSDFGDTAYLLGELDLVVTIDSAVANLAGALGTPAWVMVPTFPEFRWGIEGDHTPWYPQARLFRRSHTREWPGVIDRVARALAEELRIRRQVRNPIAPAPA